MRLSRVAVVIASVAVAVGAPLAAGAAASTSGVSTGTLAGTVMGPGAVPVVHACVYVSGKYNPPVAYTGADGSYSISGLTPSGNSSDTYGIEIDASCGTDTLSPDYLLFTANALVSAGATTTLNANLTLGGSIEGVVTDSHGEPLANVCVMSTAAQQATTASDGTYVLTGVKPGSYTVFYEDCHQTLNVQAQYYDGTQDLSSATTVTVSQGQQTQLDQQALADGGEIDIKVTDADGNLIPGLRVYPFPYGWVSNGPPWLMTSAGAYSQPDSAGYLHLHDLLSMPYMLAYDYCPPASPCRLGPIGYYQSVGLGGPPTTVWGAPGTQTLTDKVVIPPLQTSTIVVSPTSVTVSNDQPVSLDIHVSDGAADIVPTGQVDVDEGNNLVAGETLDSNGDAQINLGIFSLGKHVLDVRYFGDGESTSSQTQVTVTEAAAGGSGGSGGGGGGGGGGVAAPVSGTVNPGGSLSSDPAGTTPNASNPLVVSVTSPSGGSVSIDKTPPNTQIANYRVLNVGATITAPAATAASPLDLTFQVYDGALPNGSMPSDATVFRDGTAIPACTGAGAAPDPCVASTTTANGVTTIDVRSSHASTWDVEAADVGRVAGADRIATAVAASVDSFPDGNAGSVVLARADDYPDALVGAPLAASKNAPLLLAQGTQLPAATASEIKRVLPSGGSVYVLGGTAAVPASVADQLSGMGYHVVRYAGADRYATAVAVADALGDPGTVLLATGTNFPDALAAGPAAAHVHGAVLLTEGNKLPGATSAYLAAHAQTVSAIGGPAAAADAAATPVFGADRYATAADVATTFFAAPQTAGVATGWNFPDALSGGAQLAKLDAPLLLAAAASVPDATTSYFSARHGIVATVHVYGGSAVLTDAVINQLRAAVS